MSGLGEFIKYAALLKLGKAFRTGPINNLFGSTSGSVAQTPLTVTPAASRAAAETTRNSYATANPAWLAQYDGNINFGIFLFYSSNGNSFIVAQNRLGGQWVDNASTVGVQGAPGSGTDFSGLAAGSIPAIGPSPNFVPFESGLVNDGTSVLKSSKSMSLPSAGALTMGNFDFSNGGAAIIATDLSSGRQFYPVAYELTSTGSTKAWRESFGPGVITPAVANTSETFNVPVLTFSLVNVGRGAANRYTFKIPPGAPEVTDCNIRIFGTNYASTVPIFDFKDATGNVGFTFPANATGSPIDAVVNLPQPAFFPDGLPITVNIIGGSGNVRLMGQTLGGQTIPYVEVFGQNSVIQEIADASDTLQTLTAGHGVNVDKTNPRVPVISTPTDTGVILSAALSIVTANAATFENSTVLFDNATGNLDCSISAGQVPPGWAMWIGHSNPGATTGTFSVTITGGTINGLASFTGQKNTAIRIAKTSGAGFSILSFGGDLRGAFVSAAVPTQGTLRLTSFAGVNTDLVVGGNSPKIYFFPNASNALTAAQVKAQFATANSVSDWTAETLNTLTTDFTTTAGAKFVYIAIPSREQISSAAISLNAGVAWTDIGTAFAFFLDADGTNYAVYRAATAVTFTTSPYRIRFTTAQVAVSGITYTGGTPAAQELIVGTGNPNTAQRSNITLVGGRIPNTAVGVVAVQSSNSIRLQTAQEWQTYRFRRIQFTGSGNHVRGIHTLPDLTSANFLAVGDWVEVMNIGGTGNYNCQIQTFNVAQFLTGNLAGNGPTINVSATAVYRITYTGNNTNWLVSQGVGGAEGDDSTIVPQYWAIQSDGSGIVTTNDVEILSGPQLVTQQYSAAGSAVTASLNSATFSFASQVAAATLLRSLTDDPLFPAVEINPNVPSQDAAAAFAYLNNTVLVNSYARGVCIQPDGVAQLKQITFQGGTTMRAALYMSDVSDIVVGATLRVYYSNVTLNNGDFLITAVTPQVGYYDVDYTNADASAALNEGDGTYVVAAAAPVLWWSVSNPVKTGGVWGARLTFFINAARNIASDANPDWWTPGAGHVSWFDGIYQEVLNTAGGNLHTAGYIHADGFIEADGGIALAGKLVPNAPAVSALGQVLYFDPVENTWVPGQPLISQLPVPQAALNSSNYWQVLTFDNTGNLSMQFPRFAGYPVSRLDTVTNGDGVRFDSTLQSWVNSRTMGAVMSRRNSAIQQILPLTDVRIVFDTGDSAQAQNTNETGLTYDSSVNIGRFTNTSGRRVVLQVSLQIAWAQNATGNRFAWVRWNGVPGNRLGYSATSAAPTDVTVNNSSCVVGLDAGQYFEVWVWQTSGGGLDSNTDQGGITLGYGNRIQITRLNA